MAQPNIDTTPGKGKTHSQAGDIRGSQDLSGSPEHYGAPTKEADKGQKAMDASQAKRIVALLKARKKAAVGKALDARMVKPAVEMALRHGATQADQTSATTQR